MLYKRKDSKNWWYRFVLEGKEYAASTKTTNKKVAADIEATKRIEILKQNAGLAPKAEKPVETVSDFSTRFINQLFLEVTNERTRRYYLDAYHKLCDYKPMADARLCDVKALLIDQFKSDRQKAGDTVWQINPPLRALRRALHMAERWEIIAKAPQIKTLPQNSRTGTVSEGDLAQIARFCEPLMRAALFVLADTGMRAGELCQLQWRDVRFDVGYIELTDTADRVNGLKTENAERKIPLTARAREILVGLKSTSAPGTAYVFTRYESRQPLNVTWLSHRFTKARRAAGLPEGIVCHSLRHSLLTNLARTGVDLFTFMQIAGHSSAEVSKKYVHSATDEQIRNAGRLLENLTKSGTEVARA